MINTAVGKESTYVKRIGRCKTQDRLRDACTFEREQHAGVFAIHMLIYYLLSNRDLNSNR